MMNESSYETLDWEAEAIRMARAYGVKVECAFIETRYGKDFIDIATRKKAEISEGVVGTAGYSPSNRFYTVRSRSSWTVIQLSWLGEVQSAHVGKDFEVAALARAFFHLELLTPEVEAALSVSITAHEKLEWAREYEERYGI